MDNYAGQQASTFRGGLGQAQALQEPETDGLIMKMERAVKSLYELRSRLFGVNISLRGNRPAPEQGSKAQISERSLVNHIAELTALTEQCHLEMNEIQELLR